MGNIKISGPIHYELLYIVSNKFTLDEAKDINKKIKEEISNKYKGEITYEEEWGKKEMSYKIQQFRYGYYFLLEFDLDRQKLEKLEKYLRLSDEVIRYMLVKKKKQTADEINSEQARIKAIFNQEKSEKIEKKQASQRPVLKEDKEEKNNLEEKKELQKTISESNQEEKNKKEDKKKIDLDELDKKLDKILDADNLI